VRLEEITDATVTPATRRQVELSALLAGRPLRGPALALLSPGRRDAGAAELRLAIPAELGPETEVLAELRQCVAATEIVLATERQRAGTRVHGRRAVMQQSCSARPASFEPQRNPLQRNQDFVEDYTTAREAWRNGAKVTFPPGTY
jgi:hypothetical protein